MPLTPEQSQMVEDNIKLAYFALHKYRKQFTHLDPEEILSTCFLGLIKAVISYDPNRGEATFSTYAMQVMYRTVIVELIRGKKIEPVYLEDIASNNDDAFWQEVIGCDDSLEDEIICKILGEQIITALDGIKMGKTYKEIIRTHYREPDLTQMEIVERVGCRQKTVSLAYGEARKKLKPMVCIG